MFEQMRARMWGLGESQTDPRRGTNIDLSERDGAFVLVADLPGFEKEEIDLSFRDDVLTVSANHEMTGNEFTRARHVSEHVTLPKAVTKDDISASYRNGVLEVRLPIADANEEETGNKIEISD